MLLLDVHILFMLTFKILTQEMAEDVYGGEMHHGGDMGMNGGGGAPRGRGAYRGGPPAER